MGSTPQSNISLASSASAAGAGADLIAIIAPVAVSDDAVMRVFGSPEDIYAQHGYSEAVEYASLHMRGTRLPVCVIGIPIATPGVVSAEVTTGNTGTCDTTLTEGADGTLAEHDGVLSVITGGTIGTSQIILGLSLDGGLTTKRIRLGTANSYVIPYVGLTIAFAAGTLVAGDVIHTWHASGPKGDSSGWTSAFAAMSAGKRKFRSAIVLGDLATSTEALAIVTLANTYATTRRRHFYVRCGAYDKTSVQTYAAWGAAVTTSFAAVDDEPRIDISMGKGRVLSTFTGYMLRWPAAWGASVREYQHDLHIATWRKADGPLSGWAIEDGEELVEYDDDYHGGVASAGRFTSLRRWSNGPNGAFVSQSMTRAEDASLLVQTHNLAVVNEAMNICQSSTEYAIGESLILDADGYATAASVSQIESRVNADLAKEMLGNKRGEGPRLSDCKWTMSRTDKLNTPLAVVNGTLRTNTRGTIHDMNTVTEVR